MPKVDTFNTPMYVGVSQSKKNDLNIFTNGCKQSKMDQGIAMVYESHDFLGQTPISSSKMLFKIYIFS